MRATLPLATTILMTTLLALSGGAAAQLGAQGDVAGAAGASAVTERAGATVDAATHAGYDVRATLPDVPDVPEPTVPVSANATAKGSASASVRAAGATSANVSSGADGHVRADAAAHGSESVRADAESRGWLRAFLATLLDAFVSLTASVRGDAETSVDAPDVDVGVATGIAADATASARSTIEGATAGVDGKLGAATSLVGGAGLA